MQQTHDLNSCLKSSANNHLSKHNALSERARCINAPEHRSHFASRATPTFASKKIYMAKLHLTRAKT